MRYILCLVLLVVFLSAHAQQLTGAMLLEKSIKYHDPKGKWEQFKGVFHFEETRADGTVSRSKMLLDNKQSSFAYHYKKDGKTFVRSVIGEDCQALVNGVVPVDSIVRNYRLECHRTKLFQNYYTYLWGLPMKLKDPGTIIHEEVAESDFQGQACYALKVSYEKAVGEDIWYFYMDKKSYRLIGYRFFHDESLNDGEYITLEGETRVGKLRLPQNRKWYINKDDKYLGTDSLVKKK